MKIGSIKEETKLVDHTTAIICNKCNDYIYREGYTESHLGLEITHTFGYFAPKGLDGTKVEFDLCEKCLVAIMNRFKLVPKYTKVGLEEWLGVHK